MLDKEVYNQLFKQSFSQKTEVTYWNGSTKVYGDKDAAGDAVFKIKFNEKIPVATLMHNASLALGEAYMDKKVEIDGNIQALIYDVYNHADGFLRNSKFRKWLPTNEKHTKKQSKEDIHSHYDLGNEFYNLWLDDTLTYSCAYFKSPEDTLEQAQIQKVHHILEKLYLKPGETLLDIGCGWGTLIITAAKEYGVTATGITLSEEQFAHIQNRVKEEGLEGKVTVKLMDYRDLKDTYDHITSVGMFEHVGTENLQEYFNVIERSLNPKGSALIHGISGQRGGAKNAWINKYIFPGGYVPGVPELIQDISTARLDIIDLESLRRDYQHTLEHWTKNFHGVKDQVLALDGKDERFYRMWNMYLQSCAASFEASNIDVVQYLLVHPNNNNLEMHRANH